MRPPMPVILSSLAEPPALSLASRRSLRRRACSEARLEAASSTVSVMASEAERWLDVRGRYVQSAVSWLWWFVGAGAGVEESG